MINIIYQFFDSHPKRQQALEAAITDTQADSKVCKLKDLCRTRWVQRLDALSCHSMSQHYITWIPFTEKDHNYGQQTRSLMLMVSN